jgi:hypothetical protein
VFELAKRRVAPVPSESAVYRALMRAGMIDPAVRDRRSRKWKRWERGAPMELWQMDIVGGFPLADGTSACFKLTKVQNARLFLLLRDGSFRDAVDQVGSRDQQPE